MKMYVPDITEIWDEILSEKIIKKNHQYGNSVYDEDTIFSDIGDPEELIKIRLDDKMRRLKTLDTTSSKYDSELMEIIAYLMHLLNWRRNSGKYEEENEIRPIKLTTGRDHVNKKWVDTMCHRQSGDTEQSTGHPRESLGGKIRSIGIWRLSDK